MSCSALRNKTTENCQLWLLVNIAGAVSWSILVIGIIAQCNVGALQGVNSITSISLITVGSTTISLEYALIIFLFFKKSTPLSYFEFNRLKQHINSGEGVYYYANGNPNQTVLAWHTGGALQEGLDPSASHPFREHTLKLRDLQKRAGENYSSSCWAFFCGD